MHKANDIAQNSENSEQSNIRYIRVNTKAIWGNTNYGYADGDSIPRSFNCNKSEDWRCNGRFEDEMRSENKLIHDSKEIDCPIDENSAKFNENTEKCNVNSVKSAKAMSKDEQFLPEIFRCAKCKKKLGIIMIMKCHCEQFFCAKHRYAETHDCSYDFKKNGYLMLAKENPLVIANKVMKI